MPSKGKKKTPSRIPFGLQEIISVYPIILLVLLLFVLLIGVGVNSCMQDAENTADRVQQTKDNGKMVSIGGHAFKQTTYHDEDDVCWKIYTGGRRGNSAFALPCPKGEKNDG